MIKDLSRFVSMDKELIDYCKENNYVYIDYSSKLVEYNKINKQEILNLLFEKRIDKKYERCVFRINTDKIHTTFKKALHTLYDVPTHKKDLSLFFNKEKMVMIENDVQLNRRHIKIILNIVEEITCPICLEPPDEERRVSCPVCVTEYHYKCISNPDYPCYDDKHKYCSVCRSIIGNVTVV